MSIREDLNQRGAMAASALAHENLHKIPSVCDKSPEEETLFHEGDQFFDDLLKRCQQAKHFIYIEAYIFQHDEIGNRLLSVLEKKALEGVEVKILIDAIGSLGFRLKKVKYLNFPHFEIRLYNPLPFQAGSSRFFCPLKYLIVMLFGLFSINKRNHKKTYIIDGEFAYVGSMNITREHSFRLFGERFWRDTGILVTGKRVTTLTQAFKRTWENYLNPYPSLYDRQWILQGFHQGVRLNDTKSGREFLKEELLTRLRRAERRVWITNPYFVPDPDFLEALQETACRGVDVTIITPRKSDMTFFPLINSLASRHLVAKRIKVFEYLPRILHAKIMIIDDWCTIGSSNLNHRSFYHDLEVDLVLKNPEAKKNLCQQFLADLSQSVELHKGDFLKKYGQNIFTSAFFKVIKYWL